jgi:prepilin-type N-terminal cleavage/methylation domain-containing protein
MKTSCPKSRRFSLGFTLIELLVVIAIIAILAAMLFPAIGVAKRKAAEASARADMKNIELAIGRYEADYNGRFPAPGVATGTSDVTFGLPPVIAGPVINGVTYYPNNSNVIAILLDLEYTKETTPRPTANLGHVLNPRRVANLNANYSSGDSLNPLSGVGVDLEYRDPWGSPYVISMDTSLDDQCHDQLYSRTSVSQESAKKGYFGLSNPSGVANQFQFNGKFMIWSLGADRKASTTVNAKTGDNKDNILSWQ